MFHIIKRFCTAGGYAIGRCYAPPAPPPHPLDLSSSWVLDNIYKWTWTKMLYMSLYIYAQEEFSRGDFFASRNLSFVAWGTPKIDDFHTHSHIDKKEFLALRSCKRMANGASRSSQHTSYIFIYINIAKLRCCVWTKIDYNILQTLNYSLRGFDTWMLIIESSHGGQKTTTTTKTTANGCYVESASSRAGVLCCCPAPGNTPDTKTSRATTKLTEQIPKEKCGGLNQVL